MLPLFTLKYGGPYRDYQRSRVKACMQLAACMQFY